MDCPICLDQITDAIVLNCGHLCCNPCYVATELTDCRVCRATIKTTTPVPWFNTKTSESSLESQSLEQTSGPLDSQTSSLDRNVKNVENDLKLKLLNASSVIESRCLPVESQMESIMSHHESKSEYINNKYDDKIKELEKRRRKKLKALRNDTQDALDDDANKVKQVEYYNQGLLHVAQTCQALSKQPQEIIQQALSLYQPKIEESMFDWPLGLSPGFPNFSSSNFSSSSNSLGSWVKDSHVGVTLVYIKQINDFAYATYYLNLGKLKCNFRGHEILHIAYDEKSNDSSFYVLHRRTEFSSLQMSKYDFGLNCLQQLKPSDLAFFYLDDGAVHEIYHSNKYAKIPGPGGYVTWFRGKEIRFVCDKIINAVAHGDKLYITDLRKKTCAYPIDKPIYPRVGYPDALDKIFNDNSCNLQVFVKDGILYKYLYKDNMTYFYRDGEPYFSGKTFPGTGNIYPGARNTILYHQKEQLELFEL